jgi:hypothetical protein
MTPSYPEPMDSGEAPVIFPDSVRALLDELRDRSEIDQELVEEWSESRGRTLSTSS